MINGGYVNPIPFGQKTNIKYNIKTVSNLDVKHKKENDIITEINGFELIKPKESKSNSIYPEEFNYYVPISNFDKIMSHNNIDSYALINQKNYVIISKGEIYKSKIFKLKEDYTIENYEGDIKEIIEDDLKEKQFSDLFFNRDNLFKVRAGEILKDINGNIIDEYSNIELFDPFGIMYMIKMNFIYEIRKTFENERIKDYIDELFLPTNDSLPKLNDNIINKLIFGGELNKFVNLLTKHNISSKKTKTEIYETDFQKNIVKFMKDYDHTKNKYLPKIREDIKLKLDKVIELYKKNKINLNNDKKIYEYITKNGITLDELKDQNNFYYILENLSYNNTIDINDFEDDYKLLQSIINIFSDKTKYGNLNNTIDIINSINALSKSKQINNVFLERNVNPYITKTIEQSYESFIIEIFSFMKESLYMRKKFNIFYYFDVIIILIYFFKRIGQTHTNYPINIRQQIDDMIDQTVTKIKTKTNIDEKMLNNISVKNIYTKLYDVYIILDSDDLNMSIETINIIYNNNIKKLKNTVPPQDFDNINKIIKQLFPNSYHYDTYRKTEIIYSDMKNLLLDSNEKKIVNSLIISLAKIDNSLSKYCEQKIQYDISNLNILGSDDVIDYIEKINILKNYSDKIIDDNNDLYKIDVINYKYFKNKYSNRIPDCCETLVRHMINMFIYNKNKNIYDWNNLPSSTITDVKKYYEKYSTHEQHITIDAHNEWGNLVSNINGIIYKNKNSNYEYELKTSFENATNLIIKLFGLEYEIIQDKKDTLIKKYTDKLNYILESINTDQKYKNILKEFTFNSESDEKNTYLIINNIEYGFTSGHGSITENTSYVKNEKNIYKLYIDYLGTDDISSFYSGNIYSSHIEYFGEYICGFYIINKIHNNYIIESKKIKSRIVNPEFNEYYQSELHYFINFIENELIINVFINVFKNKSQTSIIGTNYFINYCTNTLILYNVLRTTNKLNVIFDQDKWYNMMINYISEINNQIQYVLANNDSIKFIYEYNQTKKEYDDLKKTFDDAIKKVLEVVESKDIINKKKQEVYLKLLEKELQKNKNNVEAKKNVIEYIAIKQFNLPFDSLNKITEKIDHMNKKILNDKKAFLLIEQKNKEFGRITSIKFINKSYKPILILFLNILVKNEVHIDKFIESYYQFDTVIDKIKYCKMNEKDIDSITDLQSYLELVSKIKNNALNCEETKDYIINYYPLRDETKFIREIVEDKKLFLVKNNNNIDENLYMRIINDKITKFKKDLLEYLRINEVMNVSNAVIGQTGGSYKQSYLSNKSKYMRLSFLF